MKSTASFTVKIYQIYNLLYHMPDYRAGCGQVINKMKLTPLEKRQLLSLLNRSDILQLLSSEACDDDGEITFKENYGFTMDRAHKVLKKLVEELQK